MDLHEKNQRAALSSLKFAADALRHCKDTNVRLLAVARVAEKVRYAFDEFFPYDGLGMDDLKEALKEVEDLL